MRPFRQSNLPVRPLRSRRLTAARAFTLIELIFVLALLAISAAFIASHLGNFFRGRVLGYEARRMLSLASYGQTRAIAEGVPVVLWVNTREGTYGLAVLSSFASQDGDGKAKTYAVETSLTLETPSTDTIPTSEDDDEKLGLPDGASAIRFNPDGFIDESSLPRVVVRQGTEGAIALVLKDNRLGCELKPVTDAN